jgi:pimeloyl-ACP methyl ester carboxylesterase
MLPLCVLILLGLSLGAPVDGAGVTLSEWMHLGPFPAGKGGLDGDPTLASGHGIEWAYEQRGDLQMRSELLTNGGWVMWKRVDQQETNLAHNGLTTRLSLDYTKAADWNSVVRALGETSMEVQAWVATEIHAQRTGRHVLRCAGVHSFYVNNVKHIADQYGMHQGAFGVGFQWEAGSTHTLFVKLKMVLRSGLSCSISYMGAVGGSSVVRLGPARVKPDVVSGRFFGPGANTTYVSLPVTNTHATLGISHIHWHVQSSSSFSSSKLQLTQPVRQQFAVAAGQTALVPLQLSLTGQGRTLACPLRLTVGATVWFEGGESGSVENGQQMELECRQFGKQSFVFTFVDVDGSVQASGAVAPRKACISSEGVEVACPVLLALHGTGVSARNMADAFKRIVKSKKSKKEQWEFGVRGAWVVTPTRHGAHNWENIAQRTVERAIDVLVEYASEYRLEVDGPLVLHRPADATRLLVTGHSMGGHGAWLFAVTHSTRVVGVAAMAGWLQKERYGQSNRFFEFDLQMPHLDPHLKSLLFDSASQTTVDLMHMNLVGIPVIFRTGQDDRTVHPVFGRRMLRLLDAEATRYCARHVVSGGKTEQSACVGHFITNSEVPGKEHWFWDSVKTNDGGVVNDAAMRKFYQRALNASRTAPVDSALHFECTTIDLAHSRRKHGVSIEAQVVQRRLTRVQVDVDVEGGVAHVVTRNVRKWCVADLTLQRWGAGAHKPGSSSLSLQLIVDGQNGMEIPTDSGRAVCVELGDGAPQWALVASAAEQSDFSVQVGAMNRVFWRPFVVVYGTHAADANENAQMKVSAVFFANAHAMAYDSTVQVVSDVLFEATMTEWAGSVVLVGGVCVNSAAAKVAPASSGVFETECERVNAVVMGGEEREDAEESELAILTGSTTSFRLRGTCVYEQSGTAIVHIGGSEDALWLVADAIDAIGWAHLRELFTPTIPPMVRAPLDALAADFFVLGPETCRYGYGGVLAAGWSARQSDGAGGVEIAIDAQNTYHRCR